MGAGPQGVEMVQLRWRGVGVVEKGVPGDPNRESIVQVGRGFRFFFDEVNIDLALQTHFGKGGLLIEQFRFPRHALIGPARFALGKRAAAAYAQGWETVALPEFSGLF